MAGRFIEALEATTIHGINARVGLLADLFLPFYTHDAPAALANNYNAMVNRMHDDYLDFVSFRYHHGRSDTGFRRGCQKLSR